MRQSSLAIQSRRKQKFGPRERQRGLMFPVSALQSGTDMTGRPGDRTVEMNGGSTASYFARHPLRPCDFAYFIMNS